MSSVDVPGSRADAQRDRILCAALKCFIEHGFHAASMANIAEVAQMSPGLIYRYFDSKDAIVLAIVQRQLAEKQLAIRQLQSSEQIIDGLTQAFEQWGRRGANTMSVALQLEMSAEATRNPQIAEALRASDAQTRGQFEEWLRRPSAEGGAGVASGDVRALALAVRVVVDGLTLRAAREPDLDADEIRAALELLVQPLLRSG
ncbi:MAG TPA: TetR/AcrR family transcriptional regulator [Steroidobacteraceae bacterium]|nr:TetR/AcrR family transcriptional regulator [Steroidobacteraceae bacterium]